MTDTVELPLWLFVLILLFATVTFASHFLFPSVRWYFRRRLERAVIRLNQRLERPIQPFNLTRRHDMIQRLIFDPHVTRAISDYAAAKGIPDNVAFEQARRYAREIVPSFSAFTYFALAIRAARLLSNAIYKVRFGLQDGDALQGIDPDATVIFVMNHRSNMDYVLVTYLAADRSALSYAVGEWARVWPLSALIRAMGAYFIRRRSGNELYRTVLSSYVRLATRAGVTQAVFPEGGLSLTGALAQPKLGLLKYMVDAYEVGERDVVFVPVSINYDRVLEDGVLTSAARKGRRRFKARIGLVFLRLFRQLGLWLIGRYRKAGYAAVSFGLPVSLSAFAKDQTGDLTRALGRELMTRIAGIVPVLPVPLLSLIMLETGGQSRVAVLQQAQRLLSILPNAANYAPNVALEVAIGEALEHLIARGLLRDEGGWIEPNTAQIDILRYYANSIAHLVPLQMLTNSAAGAKEVSASAGS